MLEYDLLKYEKPVVGSTRRLSILSALLVLLASCSAIASYTNTEADVEVLINELPSTSEVGVGYSGRLSGWEFLPCPATEELGVMTLPTDSTKRSDVMKEIVEAGYRAVPLLLKHMDDARKTAIPPIECMMWTREEDEYDFNHRTRKDSPRGVNKDLDESVSTSRSHTITVGDLCFVALGQIVNRKFSATRYQPTGGLVVNSPTMSKGLCNVVQTDFKDFTETKLRQSLFDDFTNPDSDERRNGACIRLSYYFPGAVDALAVKQLDVPNWDVYRIEEFVREKLYHEKSAPGCRKLFEDFITQNGPQYSDGVLLQLFDDLKLQEADEQHNLAPPLQEKFDARNALVQLYGYPSEVKGADVPYVNTWSCGEEAGFVDSLSYTRSGKIDEAVYQIYLRSLDEPVLSIACARRLVHKGHDEELLRYCQQQIVKGGPYVSDFDQLELMLTHHPD